MRVIKTSNDMQQSMEVEELAKYHLNQPLISFCLGMRE